jgi:type IV pilus assembly protein PilE
MQTSRSVPPGRHRGARRPRRGFTLIELMVGIVVAGILAALAYPTFLDAVRKSRRSEAVAALAVLQQAQERWRASNATYSLDLAMLRIPATTSNGHYAVSVLAADATGYTLQAQARGTQAQDRACATMAISATGGAIRYGSACSTCTLATPLTDPSRCWSRQ